MGSRQGGVRHRVHRAQRTVAALLLTLREHPLPYAVLERLHATTILPAMAYELSTASDTQRSRATLRRENDVLLQAVLDTGRRPHLPPPGVRRPQAVSVVRAVRKARISYLGHIRRRPPGDPLTIASRLDLGRKKVGRPCFTFSTSVAKDMARLPEPPGWGGLLRDRRGLQGYLKGAVEEMDSSEDEVLRPGVRRFRQGLELPHQGEGELSGSE
ncbi:BTB/POZ and TAZ domain-containing protein 3 [Frankliniella fusca]|uniref:BTB/POZ and TAZ domain-containing protein 3 n=1 Tax=Frankliniella fusca TaxID=407009 RepID=A0AAE1LEF1_9NEOP|nr:BTB/POZ and TAZ domain-containing protein 3 [Frankliniella fusca]